MKEAKEKARKNILDIKNLILDILFPKTCFRCGKEGEYLCEDCEGTLDFNRDFYCLCDRQKKILQPGKCPACQNKNLDGLYFPFSYQIPLVKTLIHRFKYSPFVKELARPLSNCLKDYFLLLDKKPDFSDFLILPLPLDKKRLKWRGYNQAEEIAKYFCKDFHLEMRNDILFKVKTTKPQVKLDKKERINNIKEAFLVKNSKVINNRKILLIDDVYTTGSTMEEIAAILKQPSPEEIYRAKEVWGLVIAREELQKTIGR